MIEPPSDTEPGGPSAPTEPDDGSRRTLWRAARLGAGVVIAASFAIWIYAFSGAARRPAPDLLDDPTFSIAAEARCSEALSDLAGMPGALDAVDGPDRASQIRASTARLEQMLDELDALVGGSARDVEITTGWLADWRVLAADRYRYADAVATDPDARFLVTDISVSERLERRITRVANTNSMPSCAAPSDVG